VVVVAERHVPGDLQRGCGVDILEGGLPQRVLEAGDAVRVVVVAGRDHEARPETFCDLAHPSGQSPLIARGRAPVTDHQECQLAILTRGRTPAGERGAGDADDERAPGESRVWHHRPMAAPSTAASRARRAAGRD
jgi:hypothetical protein